jgi:hypothetical protein
MGTRHLTCVVKDGEFKVAQYGQWDGYLDGQGKTICEFIIGRLQTPGGLSTFKQRVDQVKQVDDEYVSTLWEKVGVTGGFANMDQGKDFLERYPNFHRDFGARILEYVFLNPNAEVQLDTGFAGQSLFCEWCYVIDLDKGVLEIYKGFNKAPCPEGERFANFECDRGNGYNPVKLYHTIPLSEVTKSFIPDLNKKYEEESENE